ncbi:MAG: ABC transporter substrate-binding protein [Oscillospiraceae bacterium]|nr:ABC transporter substrate-binding protein [Oscillospiraceae bacterium]
MKSYILSLLLSAVMLASLFLTGCTSGGAPEAPANPDAQDTQSATDSASSTGETITIMASQDWVKDPEMELAKKFTEETKIAVDYQIIPSDQYPNLLMTRLNSGECADIFMHQSGKFDIVSLLQIEKNGVDLSGEEWVSRFEDAVKQQVSANGKVYGITIWDQSDSYAYIYNKNLFAQYNLSPPENYEEFKAVCQTLLDNGITPVYECVASGWHHQLNFFDVSAAYDATDDNLVDKLNNNSTTFADNEIFKALLDQMKEVVDAGYWGEYYMSNVYEDLAAEMASGEYAMAVNMMGRIGDILAINPSLGETDFGIFPAPYLNNQIIAETPCGPSKFIYSGSQNQELAKQYIAFLASPENLQFMIDNETSFNSVPFSGLNTTHSDEVKRAIQAYKTGKSTVYQNAVIYLNPQWMEIGTDITSMLMGQITSADVAASIDQRRADQASAAGDDNW